MNFCAKIGRFYREIKRHTSISSNTSVHHLDRHVTRYARTSLRVRVPTHLTNSPFDLVSSPSGSRLPSIRFLLRFKVKVLIRKMAQNTDEVIQMQPLMPENQTSNDQTISIVASESIAIPNPTDTEENTNTFCCSRF